MITGELIYTALVEEKRNKNKKFYKFVENSIKRYKTQDWGDTSKYGQSLNNIAVNEKRRILAIYEKEDWKIYITTEWNKEFTRILFISEFL